MQKVVPSLVGSLVGHMVDDGSGKPDVGLLVAVEWAQVSLVDVVHVHK